MDNFPQHHKDACHLSERSMTLRICSMNLKKAYPKANVIKLAVIANQRARWCGNLLLFRGFTRQFENWLGMTLF